SRLRRCRISESCHDLLRKRRRSNSGHCSPWQWSNNHAARQRNPLTEKKANALLLDRCSWNVAEVAKLPLRRSEVWRLPLRHPTDATNFQGDGNLSRFTIF